MIEPIHVVVEDNVATYYAKNGGRLVGIYTFPRDVAHTETDQTAFVMGRPPIGATHYDANSGTFYTEPVPEPSEKEKTQKSRRAGYGSVNDQLDMIYWDMVSGTTLWRDHITQVKQQFPLDDKEKEKPGHGNNP